MPDVLRRAIAWHNNWRRKGRTEDDKNASEFVSIAPAEEEDNPRGHSAEEQEETPPRDPTYPGATESWSRWDSCTGKPPYC